MSIHHGDSLEVLRTLEANSLDSLVTDPPAGISFMGKDWDSDKGGRDQWIAWLTDVMTECRRVLKPGAHGLVWALPRTSHWTATALENAGFEIRDVVTHLFGTGFPKSLDVSKAIDKAAGAEREVVGVRPDFAARANKSRGDGDWREGTAFKNPHEIGQITAPATDAAKQWQGWGTALKPASEHWILVRKPCSEKTVAANVIKHGTGGINVDGCRIGTESTRRPLGRQMGGGEYNGRSEDRQSIERIGGSDAGRFPANLVLSHNEDCDAECCTEGCAVKMLDEQSGVTKSTTHVRRPKGTENRVNPSGWTEVNRTTGVSVGPADSGGASRFFYCAKASKSDRNRSVKDDTKDREQAPNRQVHEPDELFDSSGNPTRGHSA